MLAIAQRLRNANGFMKSATYNVDANLNLSVYFAYKFPNPTLSKAVDTTLPEWSTKVVSNKIKVVALAYNLTLQGVMVSQTGQYPIETPFRLDAIRMTQTSATENLGRVTSPNSYLQQHSYSVPNVIVNTIDVSSMLKLPLEKADTGYTRIYDTSSGKLKPHIVPQYNSNNLNNTAFRPSIVSKAGLIPMDCIIDIPDDGNVATTINLGDCIGEIPELVYLSTWNEREPISPFTLRNRVYIVGQITVLFQDVGTKLSHL